MSDMADIPITVTEGSLLGQAATAGRYILASVGSFALGRGWIDGETLQFVTGLVTVVAPLAYGMWKTYDQKTKLVTAARAAPDSIARVVS